MLRYLAVRLSFLLLSVLFGLGMPLPAVAQEETEEMEEAAISGSEPLDVHTESRIRKYLKRSTCPHGYPSDSPIMVRCAYLLEEQRSAQQSQYERRTVMERRDIRERLRLRKEPPSAPGAAAPFDPEGPGSEPLSSPQREAKVRRYAQHDNCESDVLTAEEHDRCLHLFRQRDDVRTRAIGRRRTSVLRERAFARPVSPPVTRGEDGSGRERRPPGRRGEEDGAGRKGSGVRQGERLGEGREFNPEGPGSTELSEAEENRLRRYVDLQSCGRLGLGTLRERCDYLVDLARFRQEERMKGAQSKLRERGLLNGVLIRRSVQEDYRNATDDVKSVIRTRNLKGFRRVPRTRQEAEERFKEPVLLEGDRD